MLKEKVIFVGAVGDNITDAIPIVINKASTIRESVFLNWNGVTVRVSPNSTEDEVFKEYKRGFHLKDLELSENKGELIDKFQLGLKIAEYITKIINN